MPLFMGCMPINIIDDIIFETDIDAELDPELPHVPVEHAVHLGHIYTHGFKQAEYAHSVHPLMHWPFRGHLLAVHFVHFLSQSFAQLATVHAVH